MSAATGERDGWLVAWAGAEGGGALLEVQAAGAAALAVRERVPALVQDEVAGRLARQDPDLWGEAAREEAGQRLGWTRLHEASRPLVAEIERLRGELAAEGVDRVVLCGMGGSSLAPEVVTATAGVPLVVLDSTEPQQVARVLGEDLQRTVVVVSSKSGSTVETDSQRRAFAAAFASAGIDAASRTVVVTDPGSPLEQLAGELGVRAVFQADPTVGGRYSALTAFGLVPSGLAGADVGRLLDEAAEVADLLAEDADSNPALVLGAALGASAAPDGGLRDKVVLAEAGSGIAGFPDWAEQLIAESTGKDGTGLLPVVVEDGAPELTSGADDVLVVRLTAPATGDEAGDESGSEGADGDAGGDAGGAGNDGATGGATVAVAGSLGAQMLLWETATAVAGRLLGINPFDQPDVESAKEAARGFLDEEPESTDPAFVDGAVEVRATPGLLDGVENLAGAVRALLDQVGPRGYLAVMAYLDREAEASLADARGALAERCGRPVTWGWGPRFLHSTGQFHKGGPPVGVFLQVTAAATTDVEVPERPFTFGRLVTAQAAGDAQVLADHGRPVLRLHLTDRAEGLQQLRSALEHEALGEGA